MRVNNYIRIGYPPALTVLTFDDLDPTQVETVRAKVREITGGQSYNNIGLWKKCTGLSFPLIGESSGVRVRSNLV